MSLTLKTYGRKEKSYQACCDECGWEGLVRVSPATAEWDYACHEERDHPVRVVRA